MKRRTFVGCLILVFVSFLLIFTLGIYGIFHFLPSYQGTLERVLSEVFGAEVSLNVHYAGWRGIDPIVEADHIHVASNKMRIDLANIRVELDTIKSLFHGRIVTRVVELKKPNITLSFANQANSFSIQTINFDAINALGKRWNAVLAYLVAQTKLVIVDMTIHVNDQHHTDLIYRLNADYHKLWFNQSGMLRLKLHFGHKKAILNARVNRRQKVLYFSAVLSDTKDVLVNLINRLAGGQYIHHLVNGMLILDTLTDAKGLESAEIKGQVAGIEVKNPLIKPLCLKDILFHLHLQNEHQHFKLIASPLTFVAADKRFNFNSGLFSLSKHRLHVEIPQLDLADFSSLIRRDQPLWRKNIMLTGKLQRVNFSIDLDEPHLDHITLKSKFTDLSIGQSAGSFDFDRLSGTVVLDHQSFHLMLDSPQFQLKQNRIFTRPWPKIDLKATIQGLWNDHTIKIKVPNLVIRNHHLNYQGALDFNIPIDHPSDFKIKVDGHFHGKDLSSEYQSFLPKQGIPPPLYHWLMRCLYRAKEIAGAVKIDGVARDIPFYRKQGVFYIKAQVKDGELSPYFGWGIARKVDGTLLIDQQRLSVQVDRGFLDKVPVQSANIRVDNIAPHVPSAIVIKGQATGPADKAVRYLQTTEQKSIVDAFLPYLDYHGKIHLALSLDFPIGTHQKADRISGVVTTEGGYLTLKKPLKRRLYDVRGEIRFLNNTITFPGLSGFFDAASPLDIKGKLTVKDKALEQALIVAKGALPAAVILPQSQAYYPHFNTPLLSGSLPFSLKLQGNQGQGQLNIRSDFAGLKSRLKPPLSKNQLTYFPSRLHVLWQQQSKQKGMIPVWRVDGTFRLMNRLVAATRFQWSSGQIQNVSLNADLTAVDLNGIGELSEALSAISARQNSGFPFLAALPALAQPSLGSDTRLSPWNIHAMVYQSPYDVWYRALIRRLKLNAVLTFNALTLNHYRYQDVVVTATSDDTSTRLQLKQMPKTKDGQKISIIAPFQLNKPVEVDVQHLFIPTASSERNKPDLQAFLNAIIVPASLVRLPSVNLRGADLQIGPYRIPHLLLSLKASGSDFLVPIFSMYDAKSKLLASVVLSGRQSQLKAYLDSSNWGEALGHLARNTWLRHTEGALDAELDWHSFTPKARNLNGQVGFKFTNGTLLSVNTGFARYIGLLSLDAYFKRFFLSDHAIVGPGMAFNSITGRYRIKNGIATSAPSVIIDTPGFALVIDGKVNVITRQLNQTIRYQPHMSGTTAVVAGFLVNPLVGVAAYVGGRLLGNTLFKSTGLATLKVTGTWDKPEVEKVF